MNKIIKEYKIKGLGLGDDLRGVMADWVDRYDWQYWFTGTFRPERSYRDTIKTKMAFKRFIGDLGDAFNKKEIEYFLAVERFRHGDFTHCHALLNGLDGLTYGQIGEIWRKRYGREQVEKYQPGKGANYYLTKYVMKDLCDWGIQIRNTKTKALLHQSVTAPTKRR